MTIGRQNPSRRHVESTHTWALKNCCLGLRHKGDGEGGTRRRGESKDAWLPTCRAVAKHQPQHLSTLFSLMYTLQKFTLSCSKLPRSSSFLPPHRSPHSPPHPASSYTVPCKDFENLPVLIREEANYYFPSTWAERKHAGLLCGPYISVLSLKLQ